MTKNANWEILIKNLFSFKKMKRFDGVKGGKH